MHKYYSISAKNTGALLSRINEMTNLRFASALHLYQSIEYWKEKNVDCKLINIIKEDDWYVAFIERVRIS